VIRAAKDRGVKVILIANQVSPDGLHQLLRWAPMISCPIRCPKARCTMPSTGCASPPAVPEQPPKADAAPEHRGRHTPASRPRATATGVILPVHGMAGGVGATTFAVNLAWELANVDKADAAARLPSRP
jgi:pilus assembly protein CpaE